MHNPHIAWSAGDAKGMDRELKVAIDEAMRMLKGGVGPRPLPEQK